MPEVSSSCIPSNVNTTVSIHSLTALPNMIGFKPSVHVTSCSCP